MESAEPTTDNPQPRSLSALALGGYAVFDFLGPGLVSLFGDREISGPLTLLLLFLLGSLVGQVGALVAWGALGTGRTSLRWTASLLAAECLLCLFQLGTAAFSGKKGLHDVSGLLLMLPLAFLSAQLPLWGMRYGWRYRIIHARRPSLVTVTFQLAAHIFRDHGHCPGLGLHARRFNED